MTSPFKTFQEFNEAEGPIYTFANNSAIIGILIVLSALILLYFIYMSYAMKQDTPKGPVSLGAIILAGALSLAGLSHTHAPKQTPETARRQSQSELARLQPLALLGMVGIGTKTLRQRHRKPRRSSRFSNRDRSR
jgi:hypothetical protein